MKFWKYRLLSAQAETKGASGMGSLKMERLVIIGRNVSASRVSVSQRASAMRMTFTNQVAGRQTYDPAYEIL